MNGQNTQAQVTLPTTVLEHPGFYALRPEWLDSDEERQAFRAQFPEFVEKYSDCWVTDSAEVALA